MKSIFYPQKGQQPFPVTQSTVLTNATNDSIYLTPSLRHCVLYTVQVTWSKVDDASSYGQLSEQAETLHRPDEPLQSGQHLPRVHHLHQPSRLLHRQPPADMYCSQAPNKHQHHHQHHWGQGGGQVVNVTGQ